MIYGCKEVNIIAVRSTPLAPQPCGFPTVACTSCVCLLMTLMANERIMPLVRISVVVVHQEILNMCACARVRVCACVRVCVCVRVFVCCESFVFCPTSCARPCRVERTSTGDRTAPSVRCVEGLPATAAGDAVTLNAMGWALGEVFFWFNFRVGLTRPAAGERVRRGASRGGTSRKQSETGASWKGKTRRQLGEKAALGLRKHRPCCWLICVLPFPPVLKRIYHWICFQGT